MARPLRLYDDRRWRVARAKFLQAHPLCADHLQRGLFVPARVVDHKIPHHGDVTLFWDVLNWQSLCKPCHDSHKKRIEQSGKTPGCDLGGVPLDPSHHWNR